MGAAESVLKFRGAFLFLIKGGALTSHSFSVQFALLFHDGEIAQLVEQRTENPRVPGSIPGLATILRPSALRLFPKDRLVNQQKSI